MAVINEYTFLWVFALGVLVQAFIAVRQPRRMVVVAGLAAASFGGAWLLSDGENRAFDMALMPALIFVLVFSVAFRDLTMPLVTRRGLLHYTLLWYYVVWLSAAGAAIEVPGWVLVAAALPVAVLLGLALWRGNLWRWIRTAMYAWFLVVALSLLGGQLSLDRLRVVFGEVGFSWQLLGYAFVSGAVFLYFGSYLVHLTMLLVNERRQAFFGRRAASPADEYAGAMAARLEGPALTAAGLAWLAAHSAVLAFNVAYEWIEAGLLINASITVIACAGLVGSEPSRQPFLAPRGRGQGAAGSPANLAVNKRD